MQPANLLNDLQAYLKLSDFLHTAGQPTRAQLENLAAQGIRAVVNLALPTSDDAVTDEGAIVTGQGIPYFHIPVVWEKPELEDFQLFKSICRTLSDRPHLIHCAKNMRVSAFIYLYRVTEQAVSHDLALRDLRKIWLPTDQWYLFVNRVRTVCDLAEVDFA